MQVTRDNYTQYAQMVQQMIGKKVSSNDPLAQCDYGNFSLRFKPVDINFTKPNWDTIMTKRDKPAMSEEEFEEWQSVSAMAVWTLPLIISLRLPMRRDCLERMQESTLLRLTM